MKKIITVAFIFIHFFVAAQRVAHTPEGNVTYKIHKGKYLLMGNENDGKIDTSALGGNKLLGPHMELKTADREGAINFLNVYGAADMVNIKSVFNKFKDNEKVTNVGAVLDLLDGTMKAITNKIAYKLKPTTTRPVFDVALKPYGVDSVVADHYDPQTFLIYLSKDNTEDAFDIANDLYRTKLFAFAEVSWLRILNAHRPDPLQGSQWALNNDGTHVASKMGADMSILKVWDQHIDGTGIKVAVLDEG